MGKVVKSVGKLKVVAKAESDLLQEARDNYVNMQKSWFRFAGSLFLIKSSVESGDENHALKGYAKDFKEYLNKDFPGVDYDYARKMCKVFEAFGKEIQKRLTKDNYNLPAINTCYLMISEKSQKSPDFEDLKMKVIDGKITYEALKKGLETKKVEVKPKKSAKVVIEPDENDSMFDEDADDTIVDLSYDEVNDDSDDALWENVKAIQNYVRILNKNIPSAYEMITGMSKYDAKRFAPFYNDCVDLYESGITNLMDAITNLEKRKK